MISINVFELMKEKYGNVASWAIWEKVGNKPMSNMGNLEIFKLEKNPIFLEILRSDVVMVGLNLSRPFSPTEPFRNFHDPRPIARDFIIQFAFENTEFYGA